MNTEQNAPAGMEQTDFTRTWMCGFSKCCKTAFLQRDNKYRAGCSCRDGTNGFHPHMDVRL
ncbi:MAG: hypothetical protein RQ867_02795, partial [Mariprofundaceae bacterium]|nr:hypothetical protein [Mariprofundaceae bacterium]